MTKTFRIESKAGADFGTFQGETAEQAFAVMVAAGGDGQYTDDSGSTAGTLADWTITEVDEATSRVTGL